VGHLSLQNFKNAIHLGTSRSTTVLKQCANRAIIIAKILSYAPHAGFPHFLDAFPSSVLPPIQ